MIRNSSILISVHAAGYKKDSPQYDFCLYFLSVWHSVCLCLIFNLFSGVGSSKRKQQNKVMCTLFKVLVFVINFESYIRRLITVFRYFVSKTVSRKIYTVGHYYWFYCSECLYFSNLEHFLELFFLIHVQAMQKFSFLLSQTCASLCSPNHMHWEKRKVIVQSFKMDRSENNKLES